MTWRIRLRSNEACEEQPFLAPDLIIKAIGETAYVDFALADAVETRNVGGLRSREALATAIIIQLFTDARAYDDDVLPDDLDPDRRGWWGDTVGRVAEQGRYDMGSRLWILRRSPMDENTAARATDICRHALQPIVDQGAVASFGIEAVSNYQDLRYTGGQGILGIGIDAFGNDGTRVYQQKYDVLWSQVAAMRGSRRAWTR